MLTHNPTTVYYFFNHKYILNTQLKFASKNVHHKTNLWLSPEELSV